MSVVELESCRAEGKKRMLMFSAGFVAGVIIAAAVVVFLFLKIINLGARSPTLYPGMRDRKMRDRDNAPAC